jgi:hypothetical protein
MKWNQTPLLPLLGAILVGWTAGHWYFHRESWGPSAALGSIPAVESKVVFPADSFEGQMQATTEVAALAKLWKEMAEGDRSTWDWQLKAAALWQRWAELDLDSALASLPLKPTEPPQPTDVWEELLRMTDTSNSTQFVHDLPHRAVFAVFAKQDLDRAIATAGELPLQEGFSAQLGILEVLSARDPQRFFDLAAQAISKVKHLPELIIPKSLLTAAFAKLLQSDTAAACRILEDQKAAFDVFGYHQNKLLQMLRDHWLQNDPAGAGRWLLSKDEGAFLPGFAESLVIKLIHQDPDLAEELATRKGGHWNFGGLMAESFALAEDVAKLLPDELMMIYMSDAMFQVKPKDLPRAVAWIDGLKNKRYAKEATLKLFPGWHRVEPDAALDWLLHHVEPATRDEALRNLVFGGSLVGLPDIHLTYPEQDSILAALPPEVQLSTVAERLGPYYVGDVDRMLELADRLPAGAAKDAALKRLAQDTEKSHPDLATVLKHRTSDVSLQTAYQAHAIATGYLRDAATATATFQSLPNGPLRDAVADEMQRTYAPDEPAAAWQWTLQIGDAATRKVKLEALLHAWPVERREEAKHCLEAAKKVLTDDEQTQMGRIIR